MYFNASFAFHKYTNQCDMVGKLLDLGLEDLTKVCPSTSLCEVGKIPALPTLPAWWMTVKMED